MSFFGPVIIILIVPLAIYLASSWRNTYYPDVLAALRAAGHDVYDFRNPGDGTDGFKWSKIDPLYGLGSGGISRTALQPSIGRTTIPK